MRLRQAYMLTLGLTAMLLPAGAGQAAWVYYSGNDLWKACNDGTAWGNAICVGFILGVADAQEISNGIATLRACKPDGIAGTQVKDIAVQFMQNNPQTRHYPAATLVAQSLSVAFPCR